MAVTIHDWNNDSSDFKNLGTHNYQYKNTISSIDWYKYYIYPNTVGNIRTSAFEFYPYYDSSGSRPISVIVDNYDGKNALTYPLEYNLTLGRFPIGWDLRPFNGKVILTSLTYNRTTSEGNYDFCPVLIEPGTVVWGGNIITPLGKPSAQFLSQDCYLYKNDSELYLTDATQNRLVTYKSKNFGDNELPRRLLVMIVGGGGGGGGPQNVPGGQAGAGGGGGAFAAVVLNLDKIKDSNADKRFYFSIGAGGTNRKGQYDEGDGGPGGPTKIIFETWNTWVSTWQQTRVITAGGGEGGSKGAHNYIQPIAKGGTVSDFNSTYAWLLCTCNGGDGATENNGTGGGDVQADDFNTYVNDNHHAGTVATFNKYTNGETHWKGGGGGASVWADGGKGGVADNEQDKANGVFGSGGGGAENEYGPVSECYSGKGGTGQVRIYFGNENANN